MELGSLRPYRHSGKFGFHALLLVPLVGALLGWPLGFGYAYLIKWIPIVYLNILITLGYGFVVGFAVAAALKFCRVRNVPVAFLLATVVGLLANYFQWNGHMHALLSGAPWLCAPTGIWGVMQQLFEHGSWAMRHGGNVTGWFLVAVWVAEAATILVLTVLVGTGTIRDTPYCEKSGSWLDEETKFETLSAFTDASLQAALAAGDLTPVIEARPRVAGVPAYGRLTLKHSSQCKDFFTLKVENVTLKTDKKGKVEVETKALTKDLILPSAMRALVEQFADLKPVADDVAERPAGSV
jgi:hypothetical protein